MLPRPVSLVVSCVGTADLTSNFAVPRRPLREKFVPMKRHLKIDLGLFFMDCRSKALIYLDEHMRRIGDLEEHIERAFGIGHVCFTSGEFYLPATENIEILQQVGAQELLAHRKPEAQRKVDRPEKSSRVEDKMCQTTAETYDSPDSPEMCEEAVSDETLLPQKTRENGNETTSLDALFDFLGRSQVAAHVETALEEPQSDRMECEGQTKPDDKQMKKNRRRRRSANGDGPGQVKVKKRKTDLICLRLPKQTNVVKSLIVSGSKTSDDRSSEATSPTCRSDDGATSVPELQNIEPSCVVNDDIPEPIRPLEDDANNVRLEYDNKSQTHRPNKTNDESSVLLSNSDDDGNIRSEFKQRQQRKRHRKRKRKDKASPRNSVDVVSSFTPPLTIAAPSIHIHFEEGAPVADENGLEADEEQTKAREDSQGKELERVVHQSPRMTKTLPREGDVISFKFLRMNPSYEPEVSKTVVGKVMEYVADRGEVRVHLTSGADQCLEPDGKFSLQEDEEEDEAPPVVTERLFQWENLIDPRLLYP